MRGMAVGLTETGAPPQAARRRSGVPVRPGVWLVGVLAVDALRSTPDQPGGNEQADDELGGAQFGQEERGPKALGEGGNAGEHGGITPLHAWRRPSSQPGEPRYQGPSAHSRYAREAPDRGSAPCWPLGTHGWLPTRASPGSGRRPKPTLSPRERVARARQFAKRKWRTSPSWTT